MGVSVSDRWSAFDETAAPGGAARALANLREAVTPWNVALAAILGLGWLALIGWTGAGPEAWQARSCAGLALQPAACRSLPPTKDASRIVPHGVTAGLAR